MKMVSTTSIILLILQSKRIRAGGCRSKNKKVPMAKLTTEEFIKRAKAVHRDRYDYSKVEYVNSHTHVQIICPIHGVFPQEPASHLQGHGCPICADVENGKRKRKWTYEKCQEEARKYRTKTEFQKGNSSAYRNARINGFLDSFDWFEEIRNPNGYWTKDRCEKEARKYKTKGEFLKGCSGAHSAAG